MSLLAFGKCEPEQLASCRFPGMCPTVLIAERSQWLARVPFRRGGRSIRVLEELVSEIIEDIWRRQLAGREGRRKRAEWVNKDLNNQLESCTE